MGKYTIMADVGKTLVNLLQSELVPEPIQKPESIGMCSPKDRGPFVLGIHPYDVKQEQESRTHNYITLPDGSVQNPPSSYEAFYMISVVSKAEELVRAMDEQRIFGRVLQVMNDNQVLPEKYMPDSLKVYDEQITVEMIKLELEEKIKIWGMFSEPYRLSAFYSVRPIMIESAVINKKKPRVSSVNISANHKTISR